MMIMRLENPPLTNLIKKNHAEVWVYPYMPSYFSTGQINAFIITHILMAPDFHKLLMVDVSDNGAGALLMQQDGKRIEHLVSCFSQKHDMHQKKYSIQLKRSPWLYS